MGADLFIEVEALSVLGNLCDRRGSTEAALHHRAAKAQGVLHQHIRLPANSSAPLHERILATSKTVFASLLFACGGWMPSKAVVAFLEAKEDNFAQSGGHKETRSRDVGVFLPPHQ